MRSHAIAVDSDFVSDPPNRLTRLARDFPVQAGWQLRVNKVSAFDPAVIQLVMACPGLAASLEPNLVRYEAALMRDDVVFRSVSYTQVVKTGDESPVRMGALDCLLDLIYGSAETTLGNDAPAIRVHSNPSTTLTTARPFERNGGLRLVASTPRRAVQAPAGVNALLYEEIVWRRRFLQALETKIPDELNREPTSNEDGQRLLNGLQSLKWTLV